MIALWRIMVCDLLLGPSARDDAQREASRSHDLRRPRPATLSLPASPSPPGSILPEGQLVDIH